MTNKKIKETQNHIASLEKQLNSLNQDALKRLDFLSQQDGIYSQLDGQMKQLTQRIIDNRHHLEIIQELLGDPTKNGKEHQPESTINTEKH